MHRKYITNKTKIQYNKKSQKYNREINQTKSKTYNRKRNHKTYTIEK